LCDEEACDDQQEERSLAKEHLHELPRSQLCETGKTKSPAKRLFHLQHCSRAPKSGTNDTYNILPAEIPDRMFYKLIFEILGVQLSGQLKMADFSQFRPARKTKFHRILIGGY
jgi:hypothetical protein